MHAARIRLSAAALAACLVSFGGAARAGVFDDDEARKAIVDLRQRLAQMEEQGRAREAASTAQLVEQIGALRRSVLELNNQLESMRGEFAKLRGSDEQLTRDVAELQRRQKDVGQSIDDRLRKLEPTKVSLDGREFMVEADERKAYDDAVATLRGGDFDKSVTALAGFLKRYPASGYADSARFWLGNAYYGKRDYKDAIAAFRAFVGASPEHPRAPEALLALANSQAEMKDARSARRTIEDLVKTYPQSEAAQAGKERLASLK